MVLGKNERIYIGVMSVELCFRVAETETSQSIFGQCPNRSCLW